MREVLISIQPRWVEKIVSGKKTVEVRRTRPKCETPFKCYIYETKDKRFEDMGYCWSKGEYFEHHIGKVIGKFVCDKIVEFTHDPYDPAFSETADLSCVGIDGLSEYLGHKDYGYGWHITDLVVYDKPRELSEFNTLKKCHSCESGYESTACIYDEDCKVPVPITRPPQSWMYLESEDTE